jgi:DNA-binding NtrC family response regulator
LDSILVADDDAAIRTVLNQALSRAGYEVRTTGNAGDAVAMGAARATAISSSPTS